MESKSEILAKIFEDDIIKLVLSKSRKKEYTKFIIEKKEKFFQVSKYTPTQVFHENVKDKVELANKIKLFLEIDFFNLNAFSNLNEHIINITKKDKIFYKKKVNKNKVKVSISHNRAKNYLIKEGTDIEALIDMGIFDKNAKIINSMYDKYKQINKFIEIIDTSIKDLNLESLNIIDFGCGKSYLSFLLYHYFEKIKNIKVSMVGLDLKRDVIEKCNLASKKYGYDNLKFYNIDIKDYVPEFKVDMVICLHACDIASDYAIYNAIKWKAQMIFCVPCCQHEVNLKLKKNKDIFSKYGILKERFSSLMTDGIRANILEYFNYAVDLLEFVDFSHTPKNILIRAIKSSKIKKNLEKNIKEVKEILEKYEVKQKLYDLFFAENYRC